jgi:sister chromatid cohesion protein PDS5
MDKLNGAYSLLVTLYQHCPDILTNVVPVLEGQVRGDNHVLREFATRALGQMFGTIPAASGGGGAAAAQFASLAGPMMSTWKAWLGRRMDKSVAIRLAWVISARDVLVNHQEMRAEVEGE